MISACRESVRSSRSAASARRVSASHASSAARSRSEDSRVRAAASLDASRAVSASFRMASTSRSNLAFCSSCRHRSSSSCASCTSLSAMSDSSSATRRARDDTAASSDCGLTDSPGGRGAPSDSIRMGVPFRPEFSRGGTGPSFPRVPVRIGNSSFTPLSKFAPAAAAAATARRGDSYGDPVSSSSSSGSPDLLPPDLLPNADTPRSYTRAPTSDLTCVSASSTDRWSSRLRQSCVARHASYPPARSTSVARLSGESESIFIELGD